MVRTRYCLLESSHLNSFDNDSIFVKEEMKVIGTAQNKTKKNTIMKPIPSRIFLRKSNNRLKSSIKKKKRAKHSPVVNGISKAESGYLGNGYFLLCNATYPGYFKADSKKSHTCQKKCFSQQSFCTFCFCLSFIMNIRKSSTIFRDFGQLLVKEIVNTPPFISRKRSLCYLTG